MSGTKFTPGPWRTKRDGYVHSVATGEKVCSPHSTLPDGAKMSEHIRDLKANANLISAAPDMYVELEAAMNVFRFYQGHHAAKGHSDKEQTNKQYADRIAKVLAKARGDA